MSEHDPLIRPANIEDGFDHTEPAAASVWGMTIVSVVVLAVTLFAVQQYFEKIWNDAVSDKILTAPNQLLETVRGRDEWDLVHPSVLDKKTGQVRIPLATAKEMFLKEVEAGKLFYPAKPTVPKKEEPDTAAPAAGAAAGKEAPKK